MQSATGFEVRERKIGSSTARYGLYVSRDELRAVHPPVVLFLHGAGERGNDGALPMRVGLGPAIEERRESFPAIAVFPQCGDMKVEPVDGWLAKTKDAKRALDILDATVEEFDGDRNRVYLTGLSMGGFGTWSLAAADPSRWAAIVPICGGGDPEWAKKLAPLPIWCFHGALDEIVPAQKSREMIAALREVGAEPRYTEFADEAHHSWNPAYATEDLFEWMFAQKRGE